MRIKTALTLLRCKGLNNNRVLQYFLTFLHFYIITENEKAPNKRFTFWGQSNFEAWIYYFFDRPTETLVPSKKKFNFFGNVAAGS